MFILWLILKEMMDLEKNTWEYKLEQEIKRVKEDKSISEVNKSVILKFVDECYCQSIGSARIKAYMYMLRVLLKDLKKPVEECDKEDIKKMVGWIERGSQRKEVFLNLPEREFMPNMFRKELNQKMDLPLSLREVSRHLRDFEKRGFVKCINKNDPYNKIYLITDKGKKFQNKINELAIQGK